jgi:hypothetical protein
MSYLQDLGKSGKTIAARSVAPAASSGMPKMLIFAGIGAAALVGFMMLKKKKKASAAPVAISVPKVV